MTKGGAESEFDFYLRRLCEEADVRLRNNGCLASGSELALWLFVYHDATEILVHAGIIHPDLTEPQRQLIATSQILADTGTIGFVLERMQPEAVADTLGDPRGTVSVQDAILGNFSWCGVPIPSRTDPLKPMGIASFFPANDRESWSSVRTLATAKRHLNSFVSERHGQFQLLCELAFSLGENAVLTDHTQYHERRPLSSHLATMLRRILILGAPLGQLPAVACIERSLPEQASKEAAGGASMPPEYSSSGMALRFNLDRLRLDLLRQLQWSALRSSKPSEVEARLQREHVLVRPLAEHHEKGDRSLFLVIHLRYLRETAAEELRSLFAIWHPVFAPLAAGLRELPQGEASLVLRQRKLSTEAAALVFSQLARLALADDDEVDSPLFRARTSTLLTSLTDRLRYDFRAIPATDSIAGFFDIFCAAALKLGPIKKNVIALSLWQQAMDWTIVPSEPLDQRLLGASGNWRVFQRAAALKDATVISRYRPIGKRIPKNGWRVDDSAGATRAVARKDVLLTFYLCDAYLPLDLQLCAEGFALHILDDISGLSISKNRHLQGDQNGYLVLRSRRISENRMGVPLSGRWKILAEDDRHTLAAGPIAATKKKSPLHATSTLERFAAQELASVQLRESERRLQLESLRAGVAAIMARNLSHNLGSHVLARHSLRSLPSSLDHSPPGGQGPGGLDPASRSHPRRRAGGAIPAGTLGRALAQPVDRKVEQREESDATAEEVLVHVWREAFGDSQVLERYLQSRMDFVAQVATEWPRWTEPTRLVGELLWGFLAQRLILEEIVASDGIGAITWSATGGAVFDSTQTGQIRLTCLLTSPALWNQEPMKLEQRVGIAERLLHVDRFSAKMRLRAASRWRYWANLDRDLIVALPGGVAGRQAFYVILENIIRNAAKHRRMSTRHLRARQPLTIVVEILDDTDAFGAGGDDIAGAERYQIRIYDNLRLGDGVTDAINRSLQASLLDSRRQLRRSHWGLAEMKIAALYLTQGSVEHLAGPRPVLDKEPIKAIRSPAGTLGYQLSLLKPKRLAIAAP
jgi:hypothetical protein